MQSKEKKLTKNSIPWGSLFASLILFTISFIGISYGFFSKDNNISDDSIYFDDGLNVRFILDAGESIGFESNLLKMAQDNGEEYISSNTSNGIVSLTNYSDFETVTCEYEIWYKTSNVFQTKNEKELTLAIYKKDAEDDIKEMDLKNVTDEKVAEEYITVSGKNASVNQYWAYNLRYYNLSEDKQNESIESSLQGQVYFKTKKCYDGEYKGK